MDTLTSDRRSVDQAEVREKRHDLRPEVWSRARYLCSKSGVLKWENGRAKSGSCNREDVQ
jgi:hypothetical protein